mmetsp:Transcript_22936/g.39647  ORF Transcript_22936/g.39647 Transcript_22936/m.39647 type:complete len:315 (+) Transcript_22936:316-1260(+)
MFPSRFWIFTFSASSTAPMRSAHASADFCFFFSRFLRAFFSLPSLPSILLLPTINVFSPRALFSASFHFSPWRRINPSSPPWAVNCFILARFFSASASSFCRRWSLVPLGLLFFALLSPSPAAAPSTVGCAIRLNCRSESTEAFFRLPALVMLVSAMLWSSEPVLLTLTMETSVASLITAPVRRTRLAACSVSCVVGAFFLVSFFSVPGAAAAAGVALAAAFSGFLLFLASFTGLLETRCPFRLIIRACNRCRRPSISPASTGFVGSASTSTDSISVDSTATGAADDGAEYFSAFLALEMFFLSSCVKGSFLLL